MRRSWFTRAAAGAGAAALAVGTLVFLAPAASADIINVDGGASGVSATVDLGIITVTVPPTPSVTLPPGGNNSVANVNVPGVVSTGVLSAHSAGATGPGGFAQSDATVANPNVLSGTVTADAISSQCFADEAGADGSSTLVGANILGTPLLNISPPPNTQLGIPGVVNVILNGQTNGSTADTNQLTVRSLEVQLLSGLNVGDVVVSESACGAQFAAAGGGGGGEGAGAAVGGGAGARPAVVTGVTSGAAAAVTGTAPLTG